MDDDLEEIRRDLAEIGIRTARINAALMRFEMRQPAPHTRTTTNAVQVVTHDGSGRTDGYDDPPSRCCR